jgi:hypothetical protein
MLEKKTKKISYKTPKKAQLDFETKLVWIHIEKFNKAIDDIKTQMPGLEVMIEELRADKRTFWQYIKSLFK